MMVNRSADRSPSTTSRVTRMSAHRCLVSMRNFFLRKRRRSGLTSLLGLSNTTTGPVARKIVPYAPSRRISQESPSSLTHDHGVRCNRFMSSSAPVRAAVWSSAQPTDQSNGLVRRKPIDRHLSLRLRITQPPRQSGRVHRGRGVLVVLEKREPVPRTTRSEPCQVNRKTYRAD